MRGFGILHIINASTNSPFVGASLCVCVSYDTFAISLLALFSVATWLFWCEKRQNGLSLHKTNHLYRKGVVHSNGTVHASSPCHFKSNGWFFLWCMRLKITLAIYLARTTTKNQNNAKIRSHKNVDDKKIVEILFSVDFCTAKEKKRYLSKWFIPKPKWSIYFTGLAWNNRVADSYVFFLAFCLQDKPHKSASIATNAKKGKQKMRKIV